MSRQKDADQEWFVLKGGRLFRADRSLFVFAELPLCRDPALRDRQPACYANAMPALILPLIDAVTHWPERGALVGLDLGTKTVGVAVSDPDRRLATGVETIQRKALQA